ncbi:MAG: hypothetical protein LBK58_00705 [Prevotellaceae bacterium]|jgi:hypothetical protein|nr:hypothetical protein [Prevotellaceae bacterium]
MEGEDVTVSIFKSFTIADEFDRRTINHSIGVTVENKNDADKTLRNIHFAEIYMDDTKCCSYNLIGDFSNFIRSHKTVTNYYGLSDSQMSDFNSLSNPEDRFIKAIATMEDGTFYESERMSITCILKMNNNLNK